MGLPVPVLTKTVMVSPLTTSSFMPGMVWVTLPSGMVGLVSSAMT